MKYLLWFFVAINAAIGIKYLLSSFGVFKMRYYPFITEFIFAVVLLGTAAVALYIYHYKEIMWLSFLIVCSPLMLLCIVVFFSMVTGKY